MTTKATGGKITGLLALTMEGQVALSVGDPVMVTGDYECDPYDGTSPFVGVVSVANVKRDAATGNYPVANAPGDCTVEVRGLFVRQCVAAGAVTAGKYVVIDGTNQKFAELTEQGLAEGTPNTFTGDPDREIVGIALTAAAAEDDLIDVLFI